MAREKKNFEKVMKFFGSISDAEADAMRRASKEFRKGFAVRMMKSN